MANESETEYKSEKNARLAQNINISYFLITNHDNWPTYASTFPTMSFQPWGERDTIVE